MKYLSFILILSGCVTHHVGFNNDAEYISYLEFSNRKAEKAYWEEVSLYEKASSDLLREKERVKNLREKVKQSISKEEP